MGTALCEKPRIITRTLERHLHTTMSTIDHHLTHHFSQRLTTLAEWLFFSIIFLLPWQTRYILHQGTLGGEPWEYGTLSLYGVDLLIVALLVTALAARMTTPKNTLHDDTRFTTATSTLRPHTSFTTAQWMALLLLFVAFFSLNAAQDSFVGLLWWVKLAEGVALFFIVRSLHIRWEHAALAIIASALVQSGLAITQFVTQTVWGHALLGMASQDPATVGAQVIDTGVTRILRAYGSLPHPNMLAGWITIGMITSLALLQRWQHWHWQHSHPSMTSSSTPHQRTWYRLVLFTLPVLSIGLWTTLSRQAWLAIGVVIILIIATAFIRERSFPRHTTTILLIAVAPLVVFSLLFPDVFSTRFSANTRLEHASIAERKTYTEQSIQLLRTNGLRGVGIGNYTVAAYDHDQRNGTLLPGHRYQPVHNVPLLVLTELGIFGLLATMLFIFHLMSGTSWRNPAQYCWSLCLIALAVISVFDHYLWTLHFGILLFWLIAALHEQSK